MKRRLATLVLLCFGAGALLAQMPPPDADKHPPAHPAAPRPGDRTLYLWPMTIEKGAITDDAVCIGCSLTVRGHVTGDAVALWGEVEVSPGGVVDGDVTAVLGGVRLGHGARVDGDVDSVGVIVTFDPTSKVGGHKNSDLDLPNRWCLFSVITALNLALVTLGYVVLRRRADALVTLWQQHPWKVSAVGLVAAGLWCGVFPLVIHYRPDSLVKIGAALLLLMGLAVIPGYTGLSLWLGRKLLPGSAAASYLPALAGGLVISVLQLLPVVGPPLVVLFGTLALGMTLVGRFGFAPARA